MKSLRFYCLLFSLFISLALSIGYAKGVKITLNDQTERFTSISDVAKIMLTDGKVVVNKTSGDVEVTPISDVKNITFSENTGVSNALVDGYTISLYPNPCTDVVVINGISDATKVSIYSIEGKLAKTVIVSQGDEISVSDFGAGVYIVKVGSQSFKLMKK